MTSNNATPPEWLSDVLGQPLAAEGGEMTIGGQPFVVRDGILRNRKLLSESQSQTEEVFGFKWQKRDWFEDEGFRTKAAEWLIQRYGDLNAAPWWSEHGDRPVLLDIGCGAAWSTLELFGPLLGKVRYIGADVSVAVDVARTRLAERGYPGAFIQTDLNTTPLLPNSVDLAFAEGVLHHADSTEAAFKSITPLIKVGGRFLFYVYRTKGPIREFTDDYIRDRLARMTPEEAWQATMPLTKLGKILGDLNITVDIPEAIDLLEIPAGPINLQRLVYWHVFKAFHDPDRSLDELNLINYDWYAPRNAHRQTEQDVHRWCAETNFEIERSIVEEAGITIIARRVR